MGKKKILTVQASDLDSDIIYPKIQNYWIQYPQPISRISFLISTLLVFEMIVMTTF